MVGVVSGLAEQVGPVVAAVGAMFSTFHSLFHSRGIWE